MIVAESVVRVSISSVSTVVTVPSSPVNVNVPSPLSARVVIDSSMSKMVPSSPMYSAITLPVTIWFTEVTVSSADPSMTDSVPSSAKNENVPSPLSARVVIDSSISNTVPSSATYSAITLPVTSWFTEVRVSRPDPSITDSLPSSAKNENVPSPLSTNDVIDSSISKLTPSSSV